MDEQELNERLALHRQWLEGEPGGEQLVLKGTNLRGLDLSGADLRSAILERVDLMDADLHNADLRGADLRHADLRHADLRNADLRGADLRYANLRHADLRYANLRNADLRSADLRSADLCNADLWLTTLSSTGVVAIGAGPWNGAVTPTHVHMGCVRIDHDALLQHHRNGTVGNLHPGAAEWWRVWGPIVLAAMACTRRAVFEVPMQQEVKNED